jgi:hypothetical protein
MRLYPVSTNQRAVILSKKLLNLICDDEALMNKINLFRCKDNIAFKES